MLLWSALELVSPVNQHTHDVICKIFNFFYLVCMNSSSHLITAMGFERLYAVFKPFEYKEKVTIAINCKISLVCVMVVALICSSGLPIYGNDVGHCFGVQDNVRNLDIVRFQLASVTFINFLLPTLLIPIINLILIVRLQKRDASNSRLIWVWFFIHSQVDLFSRRCFEAQILQRFCYLKQTIRNTFFPMASAVLEVTLNWILVSVFPRKVYSFRCIEISKI